ncbi:nuclear transport factor 2-like protein [Allosalinactinospora lopnorensis]|uniref:hypothetical protein n=1 Tax=Allosalinactinospora lopnorensis TaxID=1352348 RepID=UPI000623D17C|nr:hypothetical protein [Allosalinactinospora lopnorensis]
MVRTSAVPGYDLAGYLTSYPHEMAFSDDEPGDVLDRYHTADFKLCNDGLLLDRTRLIEHARPARRNASSVRVEVSQTLVAGDQVAARYTLEAVMRKGKVLSTEIHMFGRLAPDGRLRRVDQITRTIRPPAGE